MTSPAPHIVFEDNHLLVVNKPAGMLVQADETGDLDLLTWGKQYLKAKYAKPGDVYLGLVHRLDRPVSGVVALARTSKAAARLSAQFRTRAVRKVYWALVTGKPAAEAALRSNLVRQAGKSSRVGDEDEGQAADLRYRRLGAARDAALLEIELGTGRHHQIRLQLAEAGLPILGDLRYGAAAKFGDGTSIALHARRLELDHPTKQERLIFEAPPPAAWAPWKTLFL